jgi:5-methylcytosine-specific restriction endonuclease McrA
MIEKTGRLDIEGTPASATVRKYLIEVGGNVCAVCGLSGQNWRKKNLVLIVDHVDGDAHNWTINNLRLVCPNCDSQLPTFKGRNKGKSTRKYTITQR